MQLCWQSVFSTRPCKQALFLEQEPLKTYLCVSILIMTQSSTITINVALDEARVPEQISWKATDSTADMEQQAKAMMVSFWDGADKSALRIDLWTKDMMVDEMADFYYQTFMTMADSFQRATNQPELSAELKTFAQGFIKKFKQEQLKQKQ